MTIGKFYSKEQVQEYSDSVQHQAETAASLESWNDRPATIDDLANRIMSGLRGQAMKFHTFGMLVPHLRHASSTPAWRLKTLFLTIIIYI